MQVATDHWQQHGLVRLYEATNAICNEAQSAHLAGKLGDDVIGGVNWAQLQCYSAERWTDHTGASGYRVWLRPGATDVMSLHAWVQAKLHAAGWADVDVRTEW